MYRGVFGRDFLNYVQDLDLVPPMLPMTKLNKSVWSNIRNFDEQELKDYMDRMDHHHRRHWTKKRKLDDVVDIKNRIIMTKPKTEGFGSSPLYQSCYSYWNMFNVILLFNPIAGESMIDCLVRREESMRGGTFDDNILLTLVSDVEDINELSSKQKKNIRNQYLYLRKSYELVIQHMNKPTWKECCKLAIDEIGYGEINFTKNRKTVRRWHIQFQNCELLFKPNKRIEREPKLFTFFSDTNT